MNICFFCSKEAYRGYEGNGDQRLWLCRDHWRMIGESFLEEFDDDGIISPVEWLDD